MHNGHSDWKLCVSAQGLQSRVTQRHGYLWCCSATAALHLDDNKLINPEVMAL